LRNFNKQHLLLAKFYINNASALAIKMPNLVKSANANNSYSGFCEFTLKRKGSYIEQPYRHVEQSNSTQ